MGSIMMELVWEIIDEVAKDGGVEPETAALTEEDVIDAAGAVYLEGDEGCAYPCLEAGAAHPGW
jgi:hypothetical protein